MRVAVNTRFLKPGSLGEFERFAKEVFIKLAERKPEHQFLFFCDEAFDSSIHFTANVTTVVIGHRVNSLLRLKWWLDIRVTRALKKYKADVFVSADSTCSLTTSIPQFLIVSDLSFFESPSLVEKSKRFLLSAFMRSFLQKAKVVATISNTNRERLQSRYKSTKANVQTISIAAAQDFHALEWEEREAIKDKYAEGAEYFIFTGGNHLNDNLLNILKVF